MGQEMSRAIVVGRRWSRAIVGGRRWSRAIGLRGSEAKRGLFSVSGGYMKHREMHVFVLIMRWCLRASRD